MELLPAAIDPQVTDVTGVVQLLSEYTPMLGEVVIVPDEVRFWVTVTAARVEVVSARAVMVSMITIAFEDLSIAIVFTPLIS